MRGEILNFYSGSGLIAGADGNRYGFVTSDYRRDTPPERGATVDFVPDGENARDIYPLAGAAPAHPSTYYVPPTTRRAAAPTEAGAVEPKLSLWGYFWRCVTSRYAQFGGRARRSEYWGFMLWYYLIVILFIVAMVAGATQSHFSEEAGETHISPLLGTSGGLLALLSLALIIPTLAVTVRRLHDVGQSGWLLLLHLLPGIGSIILFVLTCIDGETVPNRHGPPVK